MALFQTTEDNVQQRKWIVVGIMVVVGLVALGVARQMVTPVDRFVTEYACGQHGDTLLRRVEAVQRSNRFALINRTDGVCFFGPITIDPEREDEIDEEILSAAREVPAEEASEPLAVPIDDFEPVSLFRVVKIMGILFQLGFASFAVRLVGEPLLDRFGRLDPEHVG